MLESNFFLSFLFFSIIMNISYVETVAGDCNFDAKTYSDCGWENVNGFNLKRNVHDQLLWLRTWGSTSTAGSGPDRDHTFSDPVEGRM